MAPKPIYLSLEQELDLQLAIATKEFEGLDPDSAAYMSYLAYRGAIPDGCLLARTCSGSLCCNPDHLILIKKEDV
jgi:hypothetical protein